MTDSTVTGLPASLRLGDVVSATTNILTHHFVAFAGLTGLVNIPTFVLQWQTFGEDPQEIIQNGSPTYGASIAAAAFLSLVAQAVILHAAFQVMMNRPVDIGESLRRGLGRLLPIIGAGICMGLGMMVGLILLIVPGFIFAIACTVSIPACVVERLGPIQCIRRSMELTKGQRWKIFGIVLAVGMVGGMMGGIVAAIGTVALGRYGLVFNFAWTAVYGAFTAILYSVLYRDLRVLKEGLDTNRIAAVFE